MCFCVFKEYCNINEASNLFFTNLLSKNIKHVDKSVDRFEIQATKTILYQKHRMLF